MPNSTNRSLAPSNQVPTGLGSGMYRRALLRGIYATFVSMAALLWSADNFDTEPVVALTIGMLVSAFDWIDITISDRRRARESEQGESLCGHPEGGIVNIPAFLASIALACAMALCVGRVASALYVPDVTETQIEKDGRVDTVRTVQSPFSSGPQHDFEHAKRVLRAQKDEHP